MNAAEQLEPTISEPLTWAEICERRPDEWVCVVDIDYGHPRVFDFRRARVVGHSKTKREAFDQARPWWRHYKLIGGYFTGSLTVRPWARCAASPFTMPPSSASTATERSAPPVYFLAGRGTAPIWPAGRGGRWSPSRDSGPTTPVLCSH